MIYHLLFNGNFANPRTALDEHHRIFDLGKKQSASFPLYEKTVTMEDGIQASYKNGAAILMTLIWFTEKIFVFRISFNSMPLVSNQS